MDASCRGGSRADGELGEEVCALGSVWPGQGRVGSNAVTPVAWLRSLDS